MRGGIAWQQTRGSNHFALFELRIKRIHTLNTLHPCPSGSRDEHLLRPVTPKPQHAPLQNTTYRSYRSHPRTLLKFPILRIAHLLHPVHDLAVECFLDGDVRHGRVWRGAMPVLHTRRKPDHIPRPDL